MPPSRSSHQLTVFLLRFLISKGEYERLEVILSPYTSESIRPYLPSTADFQEQERAATRNAQGQGSVLGIHDDSVPATVRQGTRVFASTYIITTIVDVVLIGIIKKHRSVAIILSL
jgi:hypothetical protein